MWAGDMSSRQGDADVSPRGDAAIRVLVAHDHELVRGGIRKFIAAEPDMRVSREAATGYEAIHLVRHEDFDVVILDISMPNPNGIDCLRMIRQFNKTLPVLMISGYSESQYALNMLRFGANGFFPKSAPPAELIRAIRTVARGHRYLTHNAADQFAAQLGRSTEKRPHELLSAREYQVFHKLAGGEGPTQIGNDLNLSVKTVSSYRGRVLRKLELRKNADVMHYAMKHGLID